MWIGQFIDKLNKVVRMRGVFRNIYAEHNGVLYNGLYYYGLYVSALPINHIFAYLKDDFKYHDQVRHKSINEVLDRAGGLKIINYTQRKKIEDYCRKHG